MGVSAFALFFSFAVQLRMRSPILHGRKVVARSRFLFFLVIGARTQPMHGAASGEE